MLTLIRQTLAMLPETRAAGELSFLKYSTPNSGKSPHDKVLFFAFAKGACVPLVVVKTVRDSRGREVIMCGFENLTRLHSLVKGSRFENLFAAPLHLHDDEQIFSVETACGGERKRLDRAHLARVIHEYTAFQEHIAATPLRGLDELAERIVGDRDALADFYRSLPPSELKLPHVLQLGDLTEDNVLFSSAGISIVDTDYAGVIDLPGFDLVGLCSRFDPSNAKRLCAKYLPAYFSRIGAKGAGPLDRLYFLCYVAERTVRKAKPLPAQELIAGFSELFA